MVPPSLYRDRDINSLADESLSTRVRAVFAFMKDVKISLSCLIWAISWNVPELNSDTQVVAERTALLGSRELLGILTHWRRPPRRHNRGIRTKAGFDTMNKFAIDTVRDIIGEEMDNLEDVLTSPQEELSEESLLCIKWKEIAEQVQRKAPTTWMLLRSAACIPKQDERNKYKTPDLCVLMMISMAGFSRSHHFCRLQKLLAIYFKSCGLAAKALDTLHALCISMSQKWSYDGLLTLSKRTRASMAQNIAMHPWFGIHDNVNLAFRVYEQRLQNQNHFDSGTAGTIIVIKDPTCVAPSFESARLKFADGAKNPVSFVDILELDSQASGRLKKSAKYLVLKFLIDAKEFDFENYHYKDSSVFARPTSAHQLQTGPDTATCQYMLDLLHIEEVSYEGNDRVLEEWFRLVQLDPKGEQLLVWIGDQLTISRLRGLKKFRCQDGNPRERLEFLKPVPGFFHTQIALEHSLHSQHWGTRAGRGLVHAFELLNRKGLHSPSVQGAWHQNIKEGLTHVAAAHFRDVWCIIGRVQSIKELQNLTPGELEIMATNIVQEFASKRALLSLSRRPEEEQDNVLYQAILWNKDILDYLTFNDAISSGDIGLIQDLLPRLLFRFVGGMNSKYAIEVLELIQGLYREWPDDLRNFITRHCWLTNTTGRPGLFSPLDLLQEHNIRDIKNTFAAIGPFASWDYIRKMSASIPCQRRVKDHIEAEINHFMRGKSHTSPDAEEDIQNLQAAYREDSIHSFKAGRKLGSGNRVKDYMAQSVDGSKLRKAIHRWASNRLSDVATTKDYGTDDSGSDSD